MNKVKGRRKTEANFELAEMLNEIQMTEKERALLLPLMMTTCGKFPCYSEDCSKIGKYIPYLQTFWNLDNFYKRKVCIYGIFFSY